MPLSRRSRRSRRSFRQLKNYLLILARRPAVWGSTALILVALMLISQVWERANLFGTQTNRALPPTTPDVASSPPVPPSPVSPPVTTPAEPFDLDTLPALLPRRELPDTSADPAPPRTTNPPGQRQAAPLPNPIPDITLLPGLNLNQPEGASRRRSDNRNTFAFSAAPSNRSQPSMDVGGIHLFPSENSISAAKGSPAGASRTTAGTTLEAVGSTAGNPLPVSPLQSALERQTPSPSAPLPGGLPLFPIQPIPNLTPGTAPQALPFSGVAVPTQPQPGLSRGANVPGWATGGRSPAFPSVAPAGIPMNPYTLPALPTAPAQAPNSFPAIAPTLPSGNAVGGELPTPAAPPLFPATPVPPPIPYAAP